VLGDGEAVPAGHARRRDDAQGDRVDGAGDAGADAAQGDAGGHVLGQELVEFGEQAGVDELLDAE
jgi:hypothetical protein